MKKKYYTPQNQQFAPENGCLEDDPASFWERVGLFSGANLLLVSGRVHDLWLYFQITPPLDPQRVGKCRLGFEVTGWGQPRSMIGWTICMEIFPAGAVEENQNLLNFGLVLKNIDFRLEISSLCVWPKYIYTHTHTHIYIYVYIYIFTNAYLK